MKDRRPSEPSPDDAAIEREVRSGRKFSLSEAIGRAGGDLMKGASPVTRRRQAEVEIELHLDRHLRDGEGALQTVLLRRVRESEDLLASAYDAPLSTLREWTLGVLSKEARLGRLVSAVDAEWGRMYGERPHFEREGAPEDPGDPYTRASVRVALEALLETLPGEG